MSLSVVISAFNEEKKIEDCLRSASFADEIILVDNSSTDRTLEIAKKYTSKIFTRQNNPMLNVNKNFGFSKVKSDWILSLDADERITPELQREVISIVKKTKAHGFLIPRKNIIFGKWIEHSGWYPDHQLRLFKKGKGRFPALHVHELVKVEGEIEKLKNNILHYNYETILQFVSKLSIYIPSEAEAKIKAGYKVKPEDAVNFPAKEFMSRFFAREGYKDGLHGFVLSLLMAFYHLLIFAYIWEKQGFKRTEEILPKSEAEFKSIQKEMQYWFLNENIKSSGFTKSILLRLKRLVSPK